MATNAHQALFRKVVAAGDQVLTDRRNLAALDRWRTCRADTANRVKRFEGWFQFLLVNALLDGRLVAREGALAQLRSNGAIVSRGDSPDISFVTPGGLVFDVELKSQIERKLILVDLDRVAERNGGSHGDPVRAGFLWVVATPLDERHALGCRKSITGICERIEDKFHVRPDVKWHRPWLFRAACAPGL